MSKFFTRMGDGFPAEMTDARLPTKSQQIASANSGKAVSSGKVTATDMAEAVFSAMRERRFYIFSHPHALEGVKTRLEDIALGRNPTDPFAARPELGARLRAALNQSD